MLAITMSGPSIPPAWDSKSGRNIDFYDLKGVIEELFKGLGCTSVQYIPETADPRFNPGKCARILVEGKQGGVFGEIHPLVKEEYEFDNAEVQAAEFDVDILMELQADYQIEPVSAFPPILEDIALVVDESTPAGQVESLIRQTGG